MSHVAEVKVVWKPPRGGICEVFDVIEVRAEDDLSLLIDDRAQGYREKGCEWAGDPVARIRYRENSLWRELIF